MGGIPKEHFVSVSTDPARAQSPCDVAAQSGRDPLRDDEPNGGGNGKGCDRGTMIGPRGKRREAQASAQRYQDQGRSDRYKGAGKDGRLRGRRLGGSRLAMRR